VTDQVKLRILVVDDVEYMRKLVQQFLLRMENVEVVGEASDGEEAIRQVQLYKPDVTLLDMSMPEISGVDVARKIKEIHPGSRIYFFSAYDIEDFKNLVKEMLVEGFIQKASLKDELLKMVQDELERKRKYGVC